MAVEQEPYQFFNGHWIRWENGIARAVRLCPECKWPLAGALKVIPVSRIGEMIYHSGCGPKPLR